MSTKLILCKNCIAPFITLVFRHLRLLLFSVILMLLVFSCSTNHKLLSDNYQNDFLKKRVVKKENSREVFTISHKTPNPKSNKPYYWFKNGNIHMSTGNYEGFLINDVYAKFNIQSGLLEKGAFKKGLKTGVWTTWHNNGHRATVTRYKKGIKSGRYVVYDTLGVALVSGKFKKNVKHGTWINVVKKDTLNYKEGVLTIKDTTVRKPFLFKRLASKKEKTAKTKKRKKIKTTKKNVVTKKNKEKGFLYKLFKIQSKNKS